MLVLNATFLLSWQENIFKILIFFLYKGIISCKSGKLGKAIRKKLQVIPFLLNNEFKYSQQLQYTAMQIQKAARHILGSVVDSRVGDKTGDPASRPEFFSL